MQQRRAEALAMRAAGHTFDVIGERLGVTRQAAQQLVARAVAALPVESLDAVRQLESERLDGLLAAVWPSAESGDVRAVDRVLRIMERRARLLGLDGGDPTEDERVEVVVNWGRPDPNNQPEPLIVDGSPWYEDDSRD